MFEGHDTTTCSLAWTLFLIGSHPKVGWNFINDISTILLIKRLPAAIF